MTRSRMAQQPDFFVPQPDLFAPVRSTLAAGETGLGQDASGPLGDALDEPPPEDFIQRIREELTATLASVSGAGELPWSNLERAMLGEMRFHSVARWLPPTECQTLREAFAAEMARLWRVIAEAD